MLDSNEEIHFRKEINKLCKGESKLLRVYALENILKMGYEDRIIYFLSDDKNKVKLNVITAIKEKPDEKLNKIVIQCSGDDNKKIRKISLGILEKFNDPSTIQLLEQNLENSNFEIRNEVSNLLLEKNWNPNNDYQKALFYIGRQKWNELINLETQAVEPIIKSFNITEEDVKIKLLDCLAAIRGQESVDFIIKLIEETDDERIIRKSLLVLGEIKADDSLEPLLEAFEYENWKIRTSALKALSNFEDELVLNTISNLLI